MEAGPDLARALESRRLPGFQGICAIEPNGTIIHVSPSLDGKFGPTASDIVGRNFLEFVDVDEAGQAIGSFGGVLERPGFHQAIELHVGALDGPKMRADLVAENCLDSLGVVVFNIADARDRSRTTTLLDAQATLVRQIALGGSMAVALESVGAFVQVALPGFVAVAYVPHEDGYRGVGSGVPAEVVERVATALADDPAYVGALALADNEVNVAVALDGDHHWPAASRVLGDAFRCVWSAPIRHERGSPVLGCLELYGPDAVLPRDEDWIVLHLLSGLAAVAIDHSLMQHRLAQDANVDPLTAIPNRRVITAHLAEVLALGHRPIVCFIDLDHLKVVNDGLGHEAGDQVILAAAERLQAAVSDAGVVGRFGGDEFVMIADAAMVAADELADRCLRAFDESVDVGGRRWKLSASIGVVEIDTQSSPTEALRDADAAMYEAKKAGRGRWVRFQSSTRELVVRRLRLEQQLRQAIERDAIDAWFQPIVRCSDWRLFGVEVLARWRLDSGEWVQPADFIGLAEEIGLIDEVGLAVIQRARRCSAVLAEHGYGDSFVSVNLSPLQLRSDRLFDHLAHTDLRSRDRLQFEMTEQQIVDDSESTLDLIRRLVGLGAGLAIDDFGTGYSSLGALHRIPAGTLKIDRSLVDRAGTDAGDAVIAAVVGVARAYGMSTVAEGVERADHALRLRDLGVDGLQGYLLARPEPLEDLVRRLGSRSWCWDAPSAALVSGALQLALH